MVKEVQRVCVAYEELIAAHAQCMFDVCNLGYAQNQHEEQLRKAKEKVERVRKHYLKCNVRR